MFARIRSFCIRHPDEVGGTIFFAAVTVVVVLLGWWTFNEVQRLEANLKERQARYAIRADEKETQEFVQAVRTELESGQGWVFNWDALSHTNSSVMVSSDGNVYMKAYSVAAANARKPESLFLAVKISKGDKADIRESYQRCVQKMHTSYLQKAIKALQPSPVCPCGNQWCTNCDCGCDCQQCGVCWFIGKEYPRAKGK